MQEFSKRHLAGSAGPGRGRRTAPALHGGCSRIREHQGFILQPLIVQSILPGVDNRKSVEGSLGRPTFTSQFGPERWYYISRTTRQFAFSNPKPDAQVMYTLEFDKAGNVTSITDDLTLNKVANISPAGDKTIHSRPQAQPVRRDLRQYRYGWRWWSWRRRSGPRWAGSQRRLSRPGPS